MSIPLQPNRLYVPLNEIDTSGRIREDYGDLDGLKESLTKYGLLQPIVINQNKRLIAGGRRYRAHHDLGEKEIAVVFFETLNEVQLRVLEVEENIQRKDFDWKERVLAVVIAHETAKRHAIVDKGLTQWTQAQTGELLGISVGNVNNYIKLAGYIRSKDAEILKCDTVKDAFSVLLLRKEREVQKVLAQFISGKAASGTGITQSDANTVLAAAEQGLGANEEDGFYSAPTAASPVFKSASGGTVSAPVLGDEMPGGLAPITQVEIPLSKTIFKGDSIELMKQMSAGSVDHVITDIPYGIDMDMLAQDNASATTTTSIGSVADTHGVEANVALFEPFLRGAFRVLPESGYCVFWMDIDHWEKLRDIAKQVGFKIQRWPLIWHKTHTCKNQAAQYNWTKNYEHAMVLRKGNATLITPQGSSVWAGTNETERAMLGHPFVKPFKLWQWLFNAVAIKGQRLFDPYAGVGSMSIAAVESGFTPIAAEIDEVHYNRLVVNVANAYKSLHAGVKFV
jgi:ParB family chromosome partitioning protein